MSFLYIIWLLLMYTQYLYLQVFVLLCFLKIFIDQNRWKVNLIPLDKQ